MADDRVLTTYKMDEGTGKITRLRIRGDEILENKEVARYDAETQTLFFANSRNLELYRQGVTTFLAMDEKLIRSLQREDLKLDDPTAKVPTRPKKNKHEGDKTPAVVEWYKKYKPNEFETRYGFLGTYTGKVSYKTGGWEPRPKDGVPEFRGQYLVEEEVTNALVTLRKTHLSFTPEECVDWDADGSNDEHLQEEEQPFIPAERIRGAAPKAAPDPAGGDDAPPAVTAGTRGGPRKPRGGPVKSSAAVEQE